MSCHIYPVTFEFQNIEGQKKVRTVLLWTTQNRKKEWVMQGREAWDGCWHQIVNVDRHFGASLELDGFFWRLIGWSLVVALRSQIFHVLEDEINDLPEEIKNRLFEIESPDKSNKKGHEDYFNDLEEIFASFKFKILTDF